METPSNSDGVLDGGVPDKVPVPTTPIESSGETPAAPPATERPNTLPASPPSEPVPAVGTNEAGRPTATILRNRMFGPRSAFSAAAPGQNVFSSVASGKEDIRPTAPVLQSMRDVLIPLPKKRAENLPIEPRIVKNWCERLAEHSILVLACYDPDVLFSAARAIQESGQFADLTPYEVSFSETLQLTDVLDAIGASPGLVIAQTVLLDAVRADGFVRDLPRDSWGFDRLAGRLEAANSRLIVLSTPERLRQAGWGEAERELKWVDWGIDFVTPKLMAALPVAERSELAKAFWIQFNSGVWGAEGDERNQNFWNAVRKPVELVRQIRNQQGGVEAGDEIPEPDWGKLLGGEDPLAAMCLFAATFFNSGEPNSAPKWLSTSHFDALIQLMIPFAVADVAMPGETGKETHEQRVQMMRRLWTTQRPTILTRCGLEVQPSPTRQPQVSFRKGDWRAKLNDSFQNEHFWILLQHYNYIRHPEFAFAAEEIAAGATKTVTLYVTRNPGSLGDVLLELIAATNPGADPAGAPAEQAQSALDAMSEERKHTLYEWMARLLRECVVRGYADEVDTALGRLIALRCHLVAVNLLVRVWNSAGFEEFGIQLAKRFVSESPWDITLQLLDRLWRAVQYNEVFLSKMWNAGWLEADKVASDQPGRAAALLILNAAITVIENGREVEKGPLFSDLKAGDDTSARSLIQWLWNPTVESFEDDPALVQRLLFTWVVPVSVRKASQNEGWHHGDAVTESVTEGYFTALLQSRLPDNPRPNIFRVLALSTWATSDTGKAPEALGRATTSVLPRQRLADLRTSLFALDAGLSSALQLLLGGNVPKSEQREMVKTHIRALKTSLSRLRKAIAAPAEGQS